MSDGTENESDDQRRHQREVSFKKEQSLKYVAGDEEEELEEIQSTGCGILGRFPVLSVLIFAAVGIGIGIGLSFWMPENPNDKATALKWIGLVGDLFIRALKCVVLPLVFVNVAISVLEMLDVGKAGSIGWKTIGFYLLTTLMAAIFGILSSLMMLKYYQVGEFEQAADPVVLFGCPKEGTFLAEGPDGNAYCSANSTEEDANVQFTIMDIYGTLEMASSGAASDISLSDTVYDGVFTKIVTDNITMAFADANFAAVVFFAILFGVALSRVIDLREKKGFDKGIILGFFKELDACLIIIINWIIAITPFAVLSLITKAIGGQDDIGEAFANVAYLMVATIIAMIMQVIIVYMGLFMVVTRSNPLSYLRCIVPAQTMAFASASSAATIPLSIQSVMSTGRVPEHIARFIVPLGATVNMDGGAIYFPCACIWLAVLNGITPTVSDYILLVIVATIGSAGTAPVPSASLVLIITAYNTVFNTTGTPNGFSFIFAIDWFMDRLRTVTNVTGDTVVTGIVSHLTRSEHEVEESDVGQTTRMDSFAAASAEADGTAVFKRESESEAGEDEVAC